MGGKITRQELSNGLKAELDKSGILSELETSNKANLVGAINEVDVKVKTHLADLTSQEVGKGADIIGLPDPNNLFTATNVGGAMQELFTNVSNGKSLVGGAITDVDDSVVIPTDPTFNDLANAIGQISTGKKWASGTTTSSTSTYDWLRLYGSGLSGQVTGYRVEVSGLDFRPSTVFLYWNGYFTIYSQGRLIVGIDSSVYGTTPYAYYVSYTDPPYYLSHGGFLLPIIKDGVNVSWIAYE